MQQHSANQQSGAAAPAPAPVATQPPAAALVAAHRCLTCNRTYEKADHLIRHKRSHENARPYHCTRCPKAFNRQDLLQRHEDLHNRHASKHRRIIRRSERVAAACLACVSSKAKCEDHKPCSRCVNRDVTCESVSGVAYAEGHSSGPGPEAFRDQISVTAKASSNIPIDITSEPATNTVDVHFNQLLLQAQADSTIETCTVPYWGNRVCDKVASTTANPDALAAAEPISSPHAFPRHATSLAVELGCNNELSFPDDNTIGWASNDIFNFSNDANAAFWAFDFESIQLSSPISPNRKGEAEAVDVEFGANGELSRKYAAFKRSPWLWIPAQNDHTMNDADGLNVDESTMEEVIARSPVATLGGCTAPNVRIDSTVRDRMLGLLFRAKKDIMNRPLSFPSKRLLNHVIEMFFVQESCSVESWIHAPTLSPRDTRPEFLISLVSAGSNLMSEPAVWKFSLALQEVCWIALAELEQGNNAVTRELRALQAHMLWLDVAMWSGCKRKMEIAESFILPCLTMLRRSAVFIGAPDSPDLVPSAGDSEQVLEIKWRKWVERESFKKLALHVFVHDTQASIALSKPPSLFITELEFSLPAARRLWNASSATEWRIRYLQAGQPASIKPRFIDLMHHIGLLDSLTDVVDIEWCRFILIYGYWGQISAYREADRFYLSPSPSRASATSQLWLMAQHRELYRDLKDSCEYTRGPLQQSPEMKLVTDLFMMILHVSPDDLQRYAGKLGEEPARKASLWLQKWARSNESRLAIFHAGQVFCAARMLPPAKLRGFYAVALYLASLALWSWAMVTHESAELPISGGQSQSDANNVWSWHSGQDPLNIALNAPQSHETRAFLSHGCGLPGLSTRCSSILQSEGDAFISLRDPSSVLNLARTIYRENFPILSGPLPPLTENLRKLLEDLGDLNRKPEGEGAR